MHVRYCCCYQYIYTDAVCDYEGMLLGLAIAMSGGVNLARARLGGASYDCAIACFLCNVTPHCSASSYPVLNVHVSEPNDAFDSEELGYQARTGHCVLFNYEHVGSNSGHLCRIASGTLLSLEDCDLLVVA